MKSDTPNIGHLVDGVARRDAIHVAVAPVVAGEDLAPGTPVALDNSMQAWESDKPIGVVDPFLEGTVLFGERFWLFLYPNTITSLRHVWTHPAFQPKVNTEVVDDRTDSV